MADEPLTLSALVRFHREVVLPDVERVVRAAAGDLRLEANEHFDALYQRLDRLETEYRMVVAGLRRVEEGVDRVEGRLDNVLSRLEGVEKRLDDVARAQEKFALRSELQDLKARVDVLQQQITAIEGRLDT